MVKLDIGLRFPGTCEEAFNFYKSIFGGELINLQRYKEMRKQGVRVFKKDENKITFVGLLVGKDNLLMGDDNLEWDTKTLVEGNNYFIQVRVESKEEVDRIYNALSAGGKIQIPLADMFWGEYAGYFTDKYGVCWCVSYHYPKVK